MRWQSRKIRGCSASIQPLKSAACAAAPAAASGSAIALILPRMTGQGGQRITRRAAFSSVRLAAGGGSRVNWRAAMTTYLPLLGIGLVAGVLGGMFGIGGGLVIVPALILMMKLPHFDAVGTSLAALIPPVGLLGAIEYYRNGHVNLVYAALVAAGLFLGFYFGARITLGMSPETARRVYAVFLLAVSLRMLLAGK
ncbi:MAG: sulfite exporter TauE/SafE family protein [Acidobacteriota bacterium]